MNFKERTGEGIGTHWNIRRIDYNNAIEIESIPALINEFDQKYSRFKQASLVYTLNKNRTLETNDQEFVFLIKKSLEYQQITNGYFCPFIGGLLSDLGYDEHLSLKNKNKPERKESQILFLKDKIEINGEEEIDLGGIGKGFLVEKIGKLMKDSGIKFFCINGGGDILINREKINDFGDIILQNPFEQDEFFGIIPILKGAVTASGGYYRRRGNAHHLINPKIKKPSNNGIVSMHVCCEDIVTADVASTTLFVTPIEEIPAQAKKLGVEYLIVKDDKTFVKSEGFPFKSPLAPL